jgi:hypothetical protein
VFVSSCEGVTRVYNRLLGIKIHHSVKEIFADVLHINYYMHNTNKIVKKLVGEV